MCWLEIQSLIQLLQFRWLRCWSAQRKGRLHARLLWARWISGGQPKEVLGHFAKGWRWQEGKLISSHSATGSQWVWAVSNYITNFWPKLLWNLCLICLAVFSLSVIGYSNHGVVYHSQKLAQRRLLHINTVWMKPNENLKWSTERRREIILELYVSKNGRTNLTKPTSESVR